MGSIGITTGGGRITREGSLSLSSRQGTLSPEYLNRANSIVVFPNNYTEAKSIRDSIKKWTDRLGLGNASRGYAISMTGATAKEKQNLVSAINSMTGMKQNNEESYANRVQRLIDRAETWAKANGRTGLTNIEKRALGEIARSTYQRDQIDKILARDKNNSLYGGHIRTRAIRKSDY